MNKEQLRDLVVIPTLKKIPKGYSEEAVNAIMMIIAHESLRGKYLKQVKGPALGLINMEPATHDDTWENGDSIWDNAEWFEFKPKANRLIYDLEYNVFMARQRLFMKPEALPKDLSELSKHLKKHWNSIHGAATDTSYIDDYLLW